MQREIEAPKIRYTFYFDDEEPLVFSVTHREGAPSPAGGEGDIPSWALLDHCRCSHCSLPPEKGKACPAAMSILPVIKTFGERVSFEKVTVCVEMDGKEVSSRTSLQEAIRSLVGLMMALSSCPAMMMLRPMAYFHLPLGNPKDTSFRVIGMYLLGQYIRTRQGLTADWEMKGLAGIFERIHGTNEKISERLRSAAAEDATVNSLVILDVLVHSVDRDLNTDLERWKALFSVYLEDGPQP